MFRLFKSEVFLKDETCYMIFFFSILSFCYAKEMYGSVISDVVVVLVVIKPSYYSQVLLFILTHVYILTFQSLN